MSTSAAAAEAIGSDQKKSWLYRLLGDAAGLVKAFGIYLAAVVTSLTTLFLLWDQLGIWKTYGWWGMAGFAGVVLLPLVLAFTTETLPRLRERRREERLRREGIRGETIRPGYFRLQPYDARDHDGFDRPDDAHRTITDWIDAASAPLLYLTGRSGTGKSSLLAAWTLPELARAESPGSTWSRSGASPIRWAGS